MELMTIAEIAQQLHIPESTLRSWRDKFGEFIPSVGSGRRKRYKHEAVQVFSVIAELSAESLTADDIAERLSIEFTRFIDHRSDNSSNAAALELYGANRTLQRLTEAIEMIAKQQGENQQLRQDLAALEQRLSALESSKLPWYKRIGKRSR